MKKILLVILLLVTACKGQESGPQAELPRAPVYAKAARVATVPLLIEARGELLPAARYEVRAEVEGIVQEIAIQEGEWVEAGQLLFVIEKRPFELSLEQAKVALVQAKAHFDTIQKKQARFTTLHDKEFVSQNEWEALELELALAKAEVRLAAARKEDAKRSLDNASIVAKQAGRVGKIDVHPGHLIIYGVDTPLCEVVTLDPLLVQFLLTEKELTQALEVEEVQVRPLAAKDKAYPAALTFIDNHFDAASGQIILRAKLQNPAKQLRPGMCVHVELPVGSLNDVLLVPHKAVKYNQFGAFVMVIGKDDLAEQRLVRVGPEHEGDIVIHEGITVEDVVISDGLERVSIGTKVVLSS